jgi:hypothetical protein
MKVLLPTLMLPLLIALPLSTQSLLFPIDKYNGFDLLMSLIPNDEILTGGPPTQQITLSLLFPTG